MTQPPEHDATQSGQTVTSEHVPPVPAYVPPGARRSGVARLLRSRLGVFAFVVVLVSGIIAFAASTSHTVAVSSLNVGDCFDTPNGGSASFYPAGNSPVRPIPCGKPHDAQVYAEPSIAGSSYPGILPVLTEAQSACDDASAEADVSPKVPANTTSAEFYPEDASTFARQDYYVCAIEFPGQAVSQSFVGSAGSPT